MDEIMDFLYSELGRHPGSTTEWSKSTPAEVAGPLPQLQVVVNMCKYIMQEFAFHATAT